MPTLTPTAQAAMFQHAESTYPEECCGILLGTRTPSDTLITEALPAANIAPTNRHHRYEIDPRAILQADHAARSRNLEILGYYHSHPDAPPNPSPLDKDLAWEGYTYIIISVISGKATQLKIWQK